jgi:hypothetical protein
MVVRLSSESDNLSGVYGDVVASSKVTDYLAQFYENHRSGDPLKSVDLTDFDTRNVG